MFSKTKLINLKIEVVVFLFMTLQDIGIDVVAYFLLCLS